ncbi:cell division suppressor protein YneA [Alkalicoccus chagannorensis]|uniref:cell division suppressor protein YneA n=1 Tax=Alkalicoccus chagannorensis TaxID=427072 RepID=UPI000427FF6F|nr:LysM peptidoglycan-binding domain-containing protein [Alkalicoccus chagannorensis]
MKQLFKNGTWFIWVLSIGFTVGGLYAAADNETEDSTLHQEVVVSEGDSLWKIADDVSDGMDLKTEETVQWLKKHNNLDGAVVHPGQSLTVPSTMNGVAAD